LEQANCKRIWDEFGVLLKRTLKELNGESWLELEEVLPEAKQVMSSRSFGARVSELADLEEAVSFHASLVAERMRSKGLYANVVYVFAQNSPFDVAEYYQGGHAVHFPSTIDCTYQITKAALWLLRKIYRPGVYYQKAGVMLMDLVTDRSQQRDLLGYSVSDTKASTLMSTLDRVNQKYGKGTVRLASERYEKRWVMRREFKSPNYTGDWSELPKVG
jgi:DNA polymerase V